VFQGSLSAVHIALAEGRELVVQEPAPRKARLPMPRTPGSICISR
jgi:hypothetical protein